MMSVITFAVPLLTIPWSPMFVGCLLSPSQSPILVEA